MMEGVKATENSSHHTVSNEYKEKRLDKTATLHPLLEKAFTKEMSSILNYQTTTGPANPNISVKQHQASHNRNPFSFSF